MPSDSSNNDHDTPPLVYDVCTFDRLRELQRGDAITIRYTSVYSFTEQTLHGTVTRVETTMKTHPKEIVVFIDPESDSDERKDAYKSGTPPRRIHGFIEKVTGERCVVETLTANKWDRLNVTPRPEIKTRETDSNTED